jgi:hypothetical protein
MIAYVQNTELAIILDEVNDAAISSGLPKIVLSLEGWKFYVSRLDHRLDRPTVEPTPYDLRHLWVDLRHHYNQQLSHPPKEISQHEKQTSPKSKSPKSKSRKRSS